MGNVAVVTLNRPRAMNALDMTTMIALKDALEQVAADPTIGALVLNGKGGNFSAGVDLADAAAVFNGPIFSEYRSTGESKSDPMHHLERMEVPIVAGRFTKAF